MREVAPGIHHWTTVHPGIQMRVSSHWVPASRALLDPMLPEEGIEALPTDDGAPQRILLSNRHHLRHSEQFVDAFGCPFYCNEHGLHEFVGRDAPRVEPFAWGEEVAPGITACKIGVLCAEETALHVRVGRGAVAFADGLVRMDGRLGFVPDFLLGDDPEAVKDGLREAYAKLLEL